MGDVQTLVKELSRLYEKHEELAVKRKEALIELEAINKEYSIIDQKIQSLKQSLGIDEKNKSKKVTSKSKVDVAWTTEKVKEDLLAILKSSEEEFTARGLAERLQEFNSTEYSGITKEQDRKLISDISNSLKSFINKGLVVRNQKDHSSSWYYSYKYEDYLPADEVIKNQEKKHYVSFHSKKEGREIL